MYSIKAVAQATGLTVETLRAWERRYGVVVPQRDDLGRRVYGPEDVLRLRRLREATDRGHPIGRLVHMDDVALARLLHEPEPRRQGAAASAFVERILDAARRFAQAECEQVLTLAVSLMTPARLIDEVLDPLLREVGERWHRGEFAIAQERLVSATVRKHVGLVLDTYDRTARRPAIVFATLPGERHELGLLMSAMVCASHGVKAHYLGADLPAREIGRFAHEVGAAVVALSVVLVDGLERLPSQLAVIQEAAGSSGIPVWIGGSGAQALDRDSLPANCLVIGDRAELEQRLDVLPR